MPGMQSSLQALVHECASHAVLPRIWNGLEILEI